MKRLRSILFAACLLPVSHIKGVEMPETLGGEPHGIRVVVTLLEPSDSEYRIELTAADAFWSYRANQLRLPRPGRYSFRVPSLSFIAGVGTEQEHRVIVSPATRSLATDEPPERLPLKTKNGVKCGYIALFSAPKATNTHKVVYHVSRDALSSLRPPIIIAVGDPIIRQLSQ